MDLKRYFKEKKEDISDLDVKERFIDVPETKDFIISIIGPRRSGKTYFLYDIIKNKKKLSENDYIFVNFEEIELKYEDIKMLPYIHIEIYGNEPKYIFLDEVQNVKNWEKGVYYLYEKKKYKIFVTGSSSKLLSKEIATQLRGRTLKRVILPLSFKEFLGKKVEKYISFRTEAKIKSKLREYIENGGFPDIVLKKVDPDEFFEEYYDLVLYKDIVERYGIKKIDTLRTFLKYMFSIACAFFSPKKLKNYFEGLGKTIAKRTIYKYFNAILDSMIFFQIKKISSSLKKEEITLSKIYLCDTGLLNAYSNVNFGKQMENVVFLELLRRRKAGEKISYWRDFQGREVDFVLSKRNNVKELIQVTYELDEKNWNREVKPLILASKDLKCDNLKIITWEQEDKILINEKEILVIPLWKWLLNLGH